MERPDLRNVYDEDTPRLFAAATVFWGLVGMLAGLWAALELAFWQLNLDSPYLTFGRLRPLHTNAVIFAFAGNAIFAGVYYSTQRLCRTRTWSDLLSRLNFWGWQLIIVLDALALLTGHTDAKEYAEPVWPIDVLIAVVWVIFAVNFFMTLARRREPHLYVALWFYIATILTIPVLHLVNGAAMPVSLLKSYPLYSGVQDALIQWWYGHNAVGFLLTTPFLGLMYYFLPKAAGRPVYSYRLSVIHFWALIFVYIWAGPHHLLYTALPDWAQTLGMVFSIMLIAPSWGGMINGLMTLKGAWEKLRTDPILKFFVVGVTFYGMSTFEGPVLSIKSVSALGHYTDWIIGHVHSGALGWVGFTTFATLYWMVPRLWKTELYSVKLATTHFWVATGGIVLYITAMWITGVTQGLMWRAVTPEGTLMYSFIETVKVLKPYYLVRALGGALYLAGAVMMAYNLARTILQGRVRPEPIPDLVAPAAPVSAAEA
ncbi:MAG TPA: cytochrome-c oxidase, cbb3-type subunit I [Candidatus Nitrosotenuis sp.]|jgi:cytochrome c oxidase cbb3-type subunit I/II|nr:cytochrome-c oxidase, cbb3-type subunit I [Candidatus Nitrosotenuis sp.]